MRGADEDDSLTITMVQVVNDRVRLDNAVGCVFEKTGTTRRNITGLTAQACLCLTQKAIGSSERLIIKNTETQGLEINRIWYVYQKSTRDAAVCNRVRSSRIGLVYSITYLQPPPILACRSTLTFQHVQFQNACFS